MNIKKTYKKCLSCNNDSKNPYFCHKQCFFFWKKHNKKCKNFKNMMADLPMAPELCPAKDCIRDLMKYQERRAERSEFDEKKSSRRDANGITAGQITQILTRFDAALEECKKDSTQMYEIAMEALQHSERAYQFAYVDKSIMHKTISYIKNIFNRKKDENIT